MSKDPLTRTYYFNGQLLDQSTFIRDQQFTRDLAIYTNSFLYSGNIVKGMDPSAKDTTLTISSGMAFTGEGVPLFLFSDLETDMTQFDISKAGDYYICLQYSDSMQTSPVPQLQQTMTIQEQPKVATPSTTKPSGPGLVPICVATMDAKGNITKLDKTAGGLRKDAKINLGQATAPAPGPQPLAAKQPAANVQANVLAAAPPAGGAHKFGGPLEIGDASGTAAQLSVSAALDGKSGLAQTAAFAFSGAGSGAVSIGRKRSSGGPALLSASFDGNEVYALDQFGTGHTVSDKSLATDPRAISGALDALNKIAAVNLAGQSAKARRLAVLADDIGSAAPEVVGQTSDGRKTVSYDGLTCLLIEAVKALTKRLEALEKKG